MTLGIVFCCRQESSWCSAPPSPPPVSTTCCGPSPTFCSQLPFGAVKYKSAPKPPQTGAPPGRARTSCDGGLELNALVHGGVSADTVFPGALIHVFVPDSNVQTVFSNTVKVLNKTFITSVCSWEACAVCFLYNSEG